MLEQLLQKIFRRSVLPATGGKLIQFFMKVTKIILTRRQILIFHLKCTKFSFRPELDLGKREDGEGKGKGLTEGRKGEWGKEGGDGLGE